MASAFDTTQLADMTQPETAPRRRGRRAASERPAEETAAASESPDSSDAEAPPPTPDPPKPSTAIVEFPIDKCQAGFASPRFDFRASPRQAAAAKVLWSSLSERGERFEGGRSQHPSGKTVENHNDGVRWLLDRLADAIEAETGRNLLKDFDLEFR